MGYAQHLCAMELCFIKLQFLPENKHTRTHNSTAQMLKWRTRTDTQGTYLSTNWATPHAIFITVELFLALPVDIWFDFGARLVHNALLCGSMLSGPVLDGGSHLCEQRSRMCVCVGGWVGGGDTWAYTTSKRIRFEMHANC